MGGFEGSDFAFWDGRRIDCVASTRHAVSYLADYRLLSDCGIATVRDSFRWPHTEAAPGIFDWSSVRAMLTSARKAQVQGIWDLCHFGVPAHVDVCTADFPARLANFAFEAALFAKSMGLLGQWWCPVNEISY